MDRTLGIIPARYASTRFPGKPLALIQGKPMIQWVWEGARDAVDQLYVATDDPRIKKAVEDFGGNVIITSPDHLSGTDRCREALDLVETSENRSYGIVVNIQGDEPLIRGLVIRELLSCFEQEGTEIATLVSPMEKNGDADDETIVKVVLDKQSRALYFSRSKIPFYRSAGSPVHQVYYRHIGLYGYLSRTLREISALAPTPLELAESLEQLRWLENGYMIRAGITGYRTLSVDTPGDLEQVSTRLGKPS